MNFIALHNGLTDQTDDQISICRNRLYINVITEEEKTTRPYLRANFMLKYLLEKKIIPLKHQWGNRYKYGTPSIGVPRILQLSLTRIEMMKAVSANLFNHNNYYYDSSVKYVFKQHIYAFKIQLL